MRLSIPSSLFVSFILLSNYCFTQVSNYTFASSSGVYVPITGGTVIRYNDVVTNSNVTKANLDDDVYYNRPIGFSFFYNGSYYSNFGFNSNGWLILGSNTFSSSYTPISSSTAAHANIISAAAADNDGGIQLSGSIIAGGNTMTVNPNSPTTGLNIGDLVTGAGLPVSGALITAVTPTTVIIDNVFASTSLSAFFRVKNGSIRYETIGVAPNRALVLQFSNFCRWGGNGVGDRMNFQIRLNETTNKIEFVYGTWSATTASASGLQIGLKGLTNSDFNNRTTTLDWSATSTGSLNTSTVAFNATTTPVNGLTYTFTPPASPAATVGDYRTINSGSWSTPSTWQKFDGANWIAATTSPTWSDGTVSIRNGHSISSNTPLTIDQLFVDAGGGLNISSNFILNDGTGDDLVVNGAFTLSGGGLFQGAGYAMINNDFIWTGGTLAGTGVFSVSGNTTWTNGNLGRTLIIGNGKILALNGANPTVTSAGLLINNGTINWSSGYIYSAGNITNNGTFNSSVVGYSIQFNGGTPSFVNNGNFNVVSNHFYNYISFTNAGTVNLATGTSFHNNGNFLSTTPAQFTGTGTFNHQSATFTLSDPLTIPAGFTFNQAGGTTTLNAALHATDMTISGGTINGAGSLTIDNNLTWTGGSVEGAGAFTVTGNTTWDGGTLGRSLSIDNSKTINMTVNGYRYIHTTGSLINNGTANWSGGYIYAAGNITNNGTFNSSVAGYSINHWFGAPSFVNNGNFNVVSNHFYNYISFTNAGTVNLATGTSFHNNGNFLSTTPAQFTGVGTFNHQSATFTLSDPLTIPAGFTFNQAGGTTTLNAALHATDMTISGGTINGAGSLTIDNNLTWTGGSVEGAGAFTVTGNTTWDGGTLGRSLSIDNSKTINMTVNGYRYIHTTGSLINNGTANWSGGYIYAAGNITNNGTFNSSVAGYSINHWFGAPSFVNNGNFNVVSNHFYNYISFTNAGTVNLATGTSFHNNGNFLSTTPAQFTGTGTFNHQSATFTLSDPLTIPAGFTFNQAGGTTTLNAALHATDMTISGGTINGAGSLTIDNNLTWTGGSVEGAGAFTVTGNTTWDGGTLGRSLSIDNSKTINMTVNGYRYIHTTGSLINNGTANWSGGYIYAAGNITNNGTFNSSVAGYSINHWFGAPSFVNNGNFNVVSNHFYNYISFTNAGTVNLATGTSFHNNGNFLSTTPAQFTGVGTFNHQSATFTLSDPLTIPAGFTFNQAGGTTTLNAALHATDMTISGGTINGAGSLTIDNNLTWTGGSVEGAGAFTVTGNTTWDGGTLGRSLSIDNSKTINMTVNGYRYIHTTGSLINNGTANWSGGYIYSAGNITNNGTFNSSVAGYSINHWFGAPSFVNNGNFNVVSDHFYNYISFTNNNSGIIQGNGSITFGSTLTNTGTISPGASVGKLTLDGAQLFSPTSILKIELNDNSGPGIGNDLVNRAGNLTLNGKLIVTQLQPVPAGPYTIIKLTSGTISGNFSSIELPHNNTLTVTPNAVILNAVPANSYVINASTGGNGNITPSGNVAVTENEDQSFTITPNAGYKVADVIIDGASVGAVSNYTFVNVTSTHSISASFSLIAFPLVSLSASTINYGNLGLSFSLTEKIIITNTGTANLNFSNIISSNPTYSLTYSKNILIPDDTVHLVITYTPTVAGTTNATITINHNAAGSPTQVNVSGNAVATGFTYTPRNIPGFTGDLYGATFINSKTGYIAGANGQIYLTEDGGQTYTILPFNPGVTIRSIRLIGDALWIIGSNGHICVKRNGGPFQVHTTGTTEGFNSGYFVNGYYGYAVGPQRLVRRYTGGNAWQGYNPGTGNDFYGVFAYGRSAWAVGSGGAIYGYNYGTDSWSPMGPGGYTGNFYGVGFWNENIGYAVGGGGAIYRTTNGGTSWLPSNSGVLEDILKIKACGPLLAFAICKDGTVLQTKDGGNTWVKLPLGDYEFEDIEFNDCQGILIGKGGVIISFTTDACDNNYNPYYVRRTSGTPYACRSVRHGSRLNAGIGGRHGTILITTDGGNKWYGTDAEDLEDIYSIQIIGNQSFAAGSGGYLAKCNNLGAKWNKVPGIPKDRIFRSVAICGCGYKGWAVGDNGTRYYYDGINWSPRNSNGGRNFRQVIFVGDTAFAVGDGGHICRAVDDTWEDLSPDESEDFLGIAFPNPRTGYAVGRKGKIYKSIDGGNTWQPLPSPTLEDLKCVASICENELVVAGANGESYQSSDGGQTWMAKHLGKQEDINSISLIGTEGIMTTEEGNVFAFEFGAGEVVAEIIASGSTTFCEGGSVTLTASGGSNYLWSNNQTTPSIIATEAGNYGVTVSNTAGCMDEQEIEVIVKPAPAIECTLPAAICINADALVLTATPAGGSFSGTGVSGDLFNPALAGEGPHTITYSYANSEGCTSTTDTEIMVHPLTPLSFSLPATVCINADAIDLSAMPAGGSFSGDGVTNSTFNPAVAGTGNTTITYTYTNSNGCVSTKGVDIIVNDISPLTFTLPASICANENAITLSASPAGGLFSGDGVANNLFHPASIGSSETAITYTYTNNDGCTSSITQSIQVNPAPVANAGSDETVYLGYTPKQCANLTGTATGGTPGYNYQWNTGATTATINVCPVIATTYVVTTTDSKGCKATDDVTIHVVDVKCKNTKLVRVCHVEPRKQNVEICISESAVPTHLGDGDYLGFCIETYLKVSPELLLNQNLATHAVVYPNPSLGKFNISLQNMLPGQTTIVRVYNITGQLVEEIKSANASFEAGRNLHAGVYIAEIIHGTYRKNVKLVKQ